MEGRDISTPKGKIVREYIGLLGQEKFSINSIAVIMNVGYYTAKGMLQYIRKQYNCVKQEFDGYQFKYWIEKEVARGLLKND